MKDRILILTDFGPAAQQALAYAVVLSQQLHFEIILLHLLQAPPNSDPDVYARTRKLRYENALLEFGKIRTTYETYTYQNTEERLHLQTHIGYDTIEIAARDMVENYQPLMIVIGGNKKNHLQNLLVGGKTKRLLESTHTPILVVPREATPALPQKIVYATDLDQHDDIQEILDWSQSLNAQLHELQVDAPGPRPQISQASLAHFLTAEEDLHVSFVEGLDQYLQKNAADLLILFTREYPFWRPCPYPAPICQAEPYTQLPLLTLCSRY
ncbi:MAG: universal stress protein [Bernardetiaceae bacterium]